jgi:hypothetical protein
LPPGAARDPALAAIVSLLEPARIQIDEAARALRRYRQTLDLDPSRARAHRRAPRGDSRRRAQAPRATGGTARSFVPTPKRDSRR